MIIESCRDYRIGEIIEVHDTSNGGPTARAKILRRATRDEYMAEIRLGDPEFDKYAYLYAEVWPGERYYEVSED